MLELRHVRYFLAVASALRAYPEIHLSVEEAKRARPANQAG